MNQDQQNLKLLGIFHYVVGGLMALFSCFPFLHVAMGVAMLCGAFEGDNPPPPFFAWIFILFPSLFILCGWALSVLMIVTGRKLQNLKSRTFCLAIAGCECIIMPFGTVLGVFTIVMLMKDSVKELFANHAAPLPEE